MEFVPWPKTPRLENEKFVITEKIDGTNAQILIEYYPIDAALSFPGACFVNIINEGEKQLVIHTGSRNRWITPSDDNFGFSAWVQGNALYLAKILGHGRHYGEWWGKGIQRGYNAPRKTFSLFNTFRPKESLQGFPGLDIVPVLYKGSGSLPEEILAAETRLKVGGSIASPGFMNPEGICIYMELTKSIYKVPFNK